MCLMGDYSSGRRRKCGGVLSEYVVGDYGGRVGVGVETGSLVVCMIVVGIVWCVVVKREE